MDPSTLPLLLLLPFLLPGSEAGGAGYGAAVVRVAVELLGVKETAPNSGPEIDAWTREVGIFAPSQWCAIFVTHCLREASKRTGVAMPVKGAAGAKVLLSQFAGANLGDLQRAGKLRRALSAARARKEPLPPGSVLFWDRSNPPGTGWQGHTGIVESDDGETWTTIEGNTDHDDVRRVVRPKSDFRFIGAGLVE